MTAQRKDTIVINNEEYIMYGVPMHKYWEQENNKPSFFSGNTSLNRGYYAKWLIQKNMLYLIDFYGENFFKRKEYTLNDIFPNAEDKVFAYWFTGDIEIPMGKQIDYSHSFIGATYEYYSTLKIEKGIVIDSGSFLIE